MGAHTSQRRRSCTPGHGRKVAARSRVRAPLSIVGMYPHRLVARDSRPRCLPNRRAFLTRLPTDPRSNSRPPRRTGGNGLESDQRHPDRLVRTRRNAPTDRSPATRLRKADRWCRAGRSPGTGRPARRILPRTARCSRVRRKPRHSNTGLRFGPSGSASSDRPRCQEKSCRGTDAPTPNTGRSSRGRGEPCTLGQQQTFCNPAPLARSTAYAAQAGASRT